MTKLVKEFEVGAPPEKVFATISNPEKYPQWAEFVKRATTEGTRTHWVYEMGGMKVESDTEVTEARGNEVYGFRQTAGFLKSGGTRLEIRPNQRGSKVSWTMQYELPYSYLGKLVDKLRARRQFEEAMDGSIKNLIKILER